MFRTSLTLGIFVLALALFAGALPQHVRAHPHVWIDLKTQFEFNGEGRITGLQIDWTFDEFYSAFVIADAGARMPWTRRP